jgi:tRNA dimethylallyltransferase
MSQKPPLQKPVIAVVGPTATGKTALAVEIAKQLKTEVISADSQLVYRELNIGTAKPTEEEKQGIRHHMIDVVAPDEVFSAANYRDMAGDHLERLWAQARTPVVAGGTGFYIRALLEAEFIPDIPPNEAFRAEMNRLAAAEGSPALHQLLREKDPARAEDLHPNDRVRVIRALEIIEATGQPVPRQAQSKDLNILWFGLTYQDRDLLRTLIDRRIEEMLAAGWLEEVERLVNQYGPEAQALQVAHGYPELLQVVQGKRSLPDAVAQIQINIHQYARRQMTWFRRNREIRWFERDRTSWQELLNCVGESITVGE